MLKTMRSTGGKIVTIILFSLLILSFAVWGIGDIFRGQGADSRVATVGDEDISVQDFSRTLQQEVSRTQQLIGRQLDAQQIRDFGVAERALARLITQASITQLGHDLGMTVTDAQLQDSIQNDPGFKGPDGRFDPALLRQALYANNMSEQMFLANLRDSITRQQLLDASFAGLEAPEAVIEPLYTYENETRSARYVSIFHNVFADVADPDELTLQAFYEEVKGDFMAPEYRAITFIHFTAEDLLDEVSVTDEAVMSEFELRKDQFTVPEQRDLTQIVLSEQSDAEALMGAVSEGKTLEAAASELGLPGPVSLGTVSEGDLPETVGQAAFAGGEGEIVGPAQSPLGYHVLRIEGITPGAQKTFEEVRPELERDLKLAEAVDSLVTLANELDDTLAGGATLEEAAQRLNLALVTVAATDRGGRGPDRQRIEELVGQREILEEAFALEDGGESLVTETPENGYFVVRLDSVTPETEQPLAEVRERVVRRWKQEERARLAKGLADQIIAEVESGKSLEEAVAAVQTPEVAALSIETTEAVAREERDQQKVPSPQFTATLFQMKPDEVKTTVGPLSEIVVQLTAVNTPAPSAAEERAISDLAAVTLGAMQNDLAEQLLQALREEQGVSVNQNQIDLLLQNYF
ncbi:SurA N-terminal domain-containing protein [Limibacillus halophilus]